SRYISSACSRVPISALAAVTRALSTRPRMFGATRPIRMPMITTTTMISIRVKPRCRLSLSTFYSCALSPPAGSDQLVEAEDRLQDRHHDQQYRAAHHQQHHRLEDAQHGGDDVVELPLLADGDPLQHQTQLATHFAAGDHRD